MSKKDALRANQIRARKLWLFAGWAMVLLVIVLSLAPVSIELPLKASDKFLHVLAYFVLMSWFANIYMNPGKRLAYVAGFLMLGVILEFLQMWMGFRAFEVKDMAASSTGVVLAWMLAPPRLPNYLLLTEKIYTVVRGH